jgi:DNA-binding transcriptional LysR family regulator
VVLPRTSPLAAADALTFADLAGHDLILPPRATTPGWHDHVLEVCRRHGFTPGRIRHARNPEFLLGLVLAGRGIAFESESTTRREPRVVHRPLSGHSLNRTVSAAWPLQSSHPAAERFAEIAAATLHDERPAPTAVPASDADRPWSIVFSPHGGSS